MLIFYLLNIIQAVDVIKWFLNRSEGTRQAFTRQIMWTYLVWHREGKLVKVILIMTFANCFILLIFLWSWANPSQQQVAKKGSNAGGQICICIGAKWICKGCRRRLLLEIMKRKLKYCRQEERRLKESAPWNI